MSPSEEDWDRLAKRVFWDRVVSLEAWRFGITLGHKSYLPRSVKNMPPEKFVRYFGVAKFKSAWPAIRKHLSRNDLARAAMLDVIWSKLVAGTWSLKPLIDIEALSRREKEFLLAAVQSPGSSKYDLAGKLGMQYKRVHEYARDLQIIGLIRLIPDTSNPRKKLLIFPA